MALGAFYRRHRRDAAAAQSELSQALQLFEQHDTVSPLSSVVSRLSSELLCWLAGRRAL